MGARDPRAAWEQEGGVVYDCQRLWGCGRAQDQGGVLVPGTPGMLQSRGSGC